MHSILSWLCNSRIHRRAVVVLVVLAWSSLAFCGEIHDAAYSGDLEKVQTLLNLNPDLVFSKDNTGYTPLHWATFGNHIDIAELLLAHNADVNATNNYGLTSLELAAYFGHKEIAELLLNDKADVNALDNKGYTPLHMAVLNGHIYLAELLRQHGGWDYISTTTESNIPQNNAYEAIGNQFYSSDLNDIESQPKFTPIGDLGDIQSILDLRGFIPLSCCSQAKYNHNMFGDCYQWYKFPTISVLSAMYYGNNDDESVTKLSKATIFTEDQLQGEDTIWAKFAYDLARNSGQELYKAVNGTSFGYEATEPVNVLLTKQSAIVILSFEYSDIDRRRTGQILCGFEFSRTLKEYKNFYELYSTTLFGRSLKKIFSDSEPYIEKAIALCFSVN